MGRSKKTEAAPVVPAPVKIKKEKPAAPAASLANAFAQSATFFGKKEAYVQPEEPEPVVDEAKLKRQAEKQATYVPTAEEEAKAEKKKRKKDKRKAKIAEEKAQQSGEATTNTTESTDASAAPQQQPQVKAEAAEEESNSKDKSDRTVFVGNVSLDATAAAIKQLFSPCGQVASVRLRFLPVAGTAVNDHGNQKLVMKVCANKKLFTDKRDFCHAYVTFASATSVPAALQLNMTKFMDKTIRVDHENPVVDPHRSVFVGNLSFSVTDEAVWKFFNKQLKTDEEPAPVENVRVIRDRETGAGKGFGYVLLKGRALAAKALSLHGKKMEKREIRVQVCGKRTKNKKGEEDAVPKHEGRRASAGAAARIAKKRVATGEPLPAAKRAKVSVEKPKKFVKGDTPKKFVKGDKLKAPVRKAAAVGKAGKITGPRKGGMVRKGDGRKGKKVAKVPFVKPKKPKHAARKARQAAEALAAKKSAKK